MSTDSLIQLLTQALFVLVFIVSAARLIRRPRRVDGDIALFFGAAAVLIAEQELTAVLHVVPGALVNAASSSLIMALPYLLLRLVDDFFDVPTLLLRGAEVGLALAVVGLFLVGQPLPLALTLLYVLYFVGLQLYVAATFARESRRSSGVIRRRMHAAAAGSLCLGLAILMAGVQAALPGLADLWTLLSHLFALGSGLGYVLAFAPPPTLRRAWREPALRAFLARAARLPRLPSMSAIVAELERSAAESLGAPHAVIGLWDPTARALRYTSGEHTVQTAGDQMIGGRAFTTQRPIFAADAEREDPSHAEVYRQAGARAVLAAPITAGERRLGVLVVYAPRAPIFADDDLELVQFLANQAAVILESRMLMDQAARIRAREEASRLKEDFLSSAAHELQTPLTTLLAQAQLLRRRAERQPRAPADREGLERIVRETKRLAELVLDLLDTLRGDQATLLGPRESVDLVELAREACERHNTPRHPCNLTAAEPVVGVYDRRRLRQALDRLLDNAVKFSPEGGEVSLHVWREGDQARLSISDRGIGIPEADLPHLFDRYHRGENVDDRRFAGIGLGLLISRLIVEQHGGRIWATSALGVGSTFHIALPLQPATDERDSDGADQEPVGSPSA